MHYIDREVIIMPKLSEAKKRANKKWNDANLKVKYDHIHIVSPKGYKNKIQEYAAERGESLNGYINRLVKEDMEKAGRSLG